MMTNEMAIQKFLEELSRTKAQNTVTTYKNGMKVFRAHLQAREISPEAPAEQVGMETFIAFGAFLAREAYSKSTCNAYMASVKALADWLIIAGILVPTYQETLRFQKAFGELRKRRESKLPRFPKRDDVTKMKEAALLINEPSPRRERDIALVELLASSGCRISEVSRLKIGQLDLQERSAVVTGKGSKERIVFFSPEAVVSLERYWTARGSREINTPVFCSHSRRAGKKLKALSTDSIWNTVKEIAKIAGVSPFSPHYFRHAYAIRMLHETGNLALVQDLLGHSNAQSTRVYAKIYADELKNAHHQVFG